MKRRLAFSIIELVFALSILLMAFVVILTVFTKSNRYAVQSRNRTAAILLANSVMEEVEAHPYGSPRPKSWLYDVDTPVKVWTEGKRREMDFHKKIEFQNNSFVDASVANVTDLVTVTISWHEGIGLPEPGVVKAGDDKVLVIKDPVWR